jgi:NAD(P)-dependent dehydrogenase (short-subunit alcohol dehydrogenase family)
MTWCVDDMSDQSGRVAVVTGANDGLGYEVARALAGAGATVVMAVRNVEKGRAARRRILDEHGDVPIEIVELDLASLASVEAGASTIAQHHPRVDLLVNNAGVMAVPEQRTEDGFELQLATNHLGHFVLTARLLPGLLAAPAARIVAVTSTARHFGLPIDPRDPHLERRYNPWLAYGQSKLANLHFAVELQRRLERTGARVASLVAHPGLSNTHLQATSVEQSGGGISQRFFFHLARMIGMSAARGALPLLRAATDPAARGGTLYAPRFVSAGAAVRRPLLGRSARRGPARRLWEVSERETGVRFDVAELVAAHRG